MFKYFLFLTNVSDLKNLRLEKTTRKDESVELVAENDYLYVAAVRRNETTICVGAIISVHFIVTNAQCLASNLSAKGLYVRVGSEDMDQNGFVRWITKIIIHKDFKTADSSYAKEVKSNNIALLQLKMPLTGEVNFDLIPVYKKNEHTTGVGFTFGWALRNPVYHGELQKRRVRMFTPKKCKNNLGKVLKLGDDHICATPLFEDGARCWEGFGEGSLLVLKENNENVLYGIYVVNNTEKENLCYIQGVYFYTSLLYHGDWIAEQADLSDSALSDDTSDEEESSESNSKKIFVITTIVVGSAALSVTSVFLGVKVYNHYF